MPASIYQTELSQADFLTIAGVNDPSPGEPAGEVPGEKNYADLKTAYTAIFNWSSMRYESISSSVRNTLGYDIMLFINQGLQFTLALVHPDDAAQFRKMYEKIFEVFYREPAPVRSRLTFSYNLRLRAANGDYRHVLRRSVFTDLTEEGKPWLEFIESTDITDYSPFTNIKLRISLSNSSEEITLFEEHEFKNSSFRMSPREWQVLELAGKGFTSKDISAMLYLSIDTVKTHRKKIILKTGACNMAEAVRLVYSSR